jgi:putative spermidine/putrescine transport system substrate-binding protein
MNKSALLGTCLLIASGRAMADVVVMSWGGDYGAAQVEAYNRPFTASTGIKAPMLDADRPATLVKAMVESNNVTVDVAEFESPDAIRGCDEGFLERIDPAILPPAPDGSPATKDFLPGALTDCGVTTVVYSTVYAYDTRRLSQTPNTIADLFDLKRFPGKRAFRKSAKFTLEMALMADGVPAPQVYKVLSTPQGIKRAFAKLDAIKSHVVWYDANAEAARLLADGEVVMSVGTANRFFVASVLEHRPINIVWDGQIYDYAVFVIPKGAPHLADAKKYLAFATDTKRLAAFTKLLPFGPARRSSLPLVGLYKDGKTDLRPYMPTNPDHMKNAVASSYDFWVDHDTELTERFNAWLAAK